MQPPQRGQRILQQRVRLHQQATRGRVRARADAVDGILGDTHGAVNAPDLARRAALEILP